MVYHIVVDGLPSVGKSALLAQLKSDLEGSAGVSSSFYPEEVPAHLMGRVYGEMGKMWGEEKGVVRPIKELFWTQALIMSRSVFDHRDIAFAGDDEICVQERFHKTHDLVFCRTLDELGYLRDGAYENYSVLRGTLGDDLRDPDLYVLLTAEDRCLRERMAQRSSLENPLLVPANPLLRKYGEAYEEFFLEYPGEKIEFETTRRSPASIACDIETILEHEGLLE